MSEFASPQTEQERDDLEFAYRVRRSPEGSGRVLILLHGSGADETTMMPFGRDIDADATSISVRGRIIQEGSRRWFTRISPTRFHQRSVQAEARAFAGFMPKLAAAEQFDLKRAVFVGYSNGANLISSTMLLRPEIVRQAALLRAMPVFAAMPDVDLTGAEVLIVPGENDLTYGHFSPVLAELLSSRGARVSVRPSPSGHELGAQDVQYIRSWLK